MWQPAETDGQVESAEGHLPGQAEGVKVEHVDGERKRHIVHYVRVLQVNLAVLHVVAAKQQQLTFTVELNGLRGLVHFVCSLQVL